MSEERVQDQLRPEGRMEIVRRLKNEDKTYREIGKIVYGDQTERGQARARAIISKLRRSGRPVSSSRRAGVATEEKGSEKVAEGKRGPKSQESSKLSCDGEGASQLSSQLTSQPAWASPQGYEGFVRAPLAGFGSRVGYVLERDVVTAIICDPLAANVVKKSASRVTNAGFYCCYRGSVTFMAKGDVVSASDPDGDLARAAGVLRPLLIEAGVVEAEADKLASKLHHPGQIVLDELTVAISDPEVIAVIRHCEPYIPEPGRGPYVIHSPSPVMPGLKVYLSNESCLRLELIAHNVAQAFNALFMRAEFVGDVLTHLVRSPGAFDEWRAQYWHPYSHPIIINLDAGLSAVVMQKSPPPDGKVTFDSLPLEISKTIESLRDLGFLYYNDLRVHLSEKAKRSNRNDPSHIIEQLEYVDPLKKQIALILLQKVALDHGSLLKHLKKGGSSSIA